MSNTSPMYLYVKLNWDANHFKPAESKDLWIPLRISTDICRLEEGHSLYPGEYRLSVGKPFPRWPQKCCQLETRASWWCLLQCTCSSNQSVSLQNRVPSRSLPFWCGNNTCCTVDIVLVTHMYIAIFFFNFAHWMSFISKFLASPLNFLFRVTILWNEMV